LYYIEIKNRLKKIHEMEDKKNSAQIKLISAPQQKKLSSGYMAKMQDNEHEKYRLIVERANEGIFVTDENFKITFINKVMADMLGASVENLIGKNLTDFIIGDDKQIFEEALSELKRGQKSNKEFKLIRKDKSVLWLNSSYSPITDENGKYAGAVTIITNITRRKNIEAEKIKASEEWQRTFDHISDSVFIQDKNFTIIKANKATLEMLKMKEEDVIGKKCFEIFHKSHNPWKSCPFEKTRIDQKSHTEEINDPGIGAPLLVTTSPVFDEKGEFLASVHIAKDISEQKKAESELKRLASFPELNPNPITELDLSGRILYKNPTARNLMPDLEEKGVLHEWLSEWSSVMEIILGKNSERIEREIKMAGRNYRQTMTYLPAIGRIRIYGTDITELKNKEHKLITLNRLLKALSDNSKLITKAESEISYLEEVCKIIIDDCKYEMVWIGYAQNDAEKSVKPVAFSGFEIGYLETLNITWADKERGRGPTGTAIRTGRIASCQDMRTDPKFSPWRQEGLSRGYNSSIALPLIRDGAAFGAITIYSKKANAFSADEIKLLNRLTNDVVFGISVIKEKQARIEAEHSLQTSEAKLQSEKEILDTIMKNAGASIAYLDKDFNFITANSAFCRDYGRTLEDLVGKNYFDFFPSEENKLLFEKTRDTGQQIEIKEKPLIFKNQPWLDITYWDWNLIPIINNGKTNGLVISQVDVSEHVRLANELKMHGRKVEQIAAELKKIQIAVENASDIIFITDNKGKIIYINKAVKEILGYRQKELIGKKPSFWMENMPNKFFAQMWNSIYFNKKPFVGEIQDRKKDGELFIAEIKIAPILDRNGQILSFAVIERDITEAKKIDAAKTEFISLAAHQLRTPITSVNLTAEMLVSGLIGKINKESEEYLHEIMDGIKKMSEMIEMFLNVSRIEMKTFEILPRPVNIAQTIDENIKTVMQQCTNKGLEIKKNIALNLPTIYADSKVLDIVLENLLSNAIKYTGPKGVITISAERNKNNIVISVADTGFGIPKKQQNRIFEKLFRAENTSQKVEGTGLGLYLTKALIEQAGGEIKVYSEENKGSVFSILIPLTGMKKNKKPTHI